MDLPSCLSHLYAAENVGADADVKLTPAFLFDAEAGPFGRVSCCTLSASSVTGFDCRSSECKGISWLMASYNEPKVCCIA